MGPACLPRFDACGDFEVPRLGGGCRPVGVGECPEGFVGDAAGGCTLTLPSCAAGEIALPGEASCSPVSECSAPSGTLQVDASAAAGGDGSSARPFRTIGAAIAAAMSGDVIAVAEGVYAEDVVIDRPLTLLGACASKVVVSGQSAAPGAAAIVVRATAKVAGLAVQGPARGVMVEGASVSLTGLHVHDTGELGIGLRGGSLTVARVLVERTKDAGIAANGGLLTVRGAVVREVSLGGGAVSGYGIYVGGTAAGKVGTGSIERAIVSAAQSGIVALGATLTVSASYVHDLVDPAGVGIGMTHAAPLPTSVQVDGVIVTDAADRGLATVGGDLFVDNATVLRTGGPGIAASGGTVRVATSKVAVAKRRGVSVDDAQGYITRSLVSGTVESAGAGCGLCAFAPPGGTRRLNLVDVIARDNAVGGVGVDGVELDFQGGRVERSGRMGISVSGADAFVRLVAVRESRPDGVRSGDGIVVASTAERVAHLAMLDSLFERNAGVGVLVLAEAQIDRTIVRDSGAGGGGSGGADGVGILFAPAMRRPLPPKGVLADVLVERSRLAGIFVASGRLELARSVVSATRADEAAGSYGDGVMAAAGALFTSTETVPADVSIDECLVEGSARAGLGVFGSTLRVGRTRLTCNAFHLATAERFDAAAGGRGPVSLVDQGGMQCGCGGVGTTCRALGVDFLPVPPPGGGAGGL